MTTNELILWTQVATILVFIVAICLERRSYNKLKETMLDKWLDKKKTWSKISMMSMITFIMLAVVSIIMNFIAIKKGELGHCGRIHFHYYGPEDHFDKL